MAGSVRGKCSELSGRAAADPAAGFRLRGRAAARAVGVGGVPVGDGAGLDEQRRVRGVQACRDIAETRPLRIARGCRPRGLRTPRPGLRTGAAGRRGRARCRRRGPNRAGRNRGRSRVPERTGVFARCPASSAASRSTRLLPLTRACRPESTMACAAPEPTSSASIPGFSRAADPRSISAGRTGRTVSIRWFAGRRCTGGAAPSGAVDSEGVCCLTCSGDDAGDSARLMYPPY